MENIQVGPGNDNYGEDAAPPTEEVQKPRELHEMEIDELVEKHRSALYRVAAAGAVLEQVTVAVEGARKELDDAQSFLTRVNGILLAKSQHEARERLRTQ